MTRPGDLECLAAEMEANWVADRRGHLVRERVEHWVDPPHLVVASAPEGRRLALSAALPEPVAVCLEHEFSREPPGPPGQPPSGAATYLELVARALGPVAQAAGPCFLVETVPPAPDDVVLVTSDQDGAARYLPRLGGPGVDAARGPYALALVDDRPVARCATARLSARGAEAGTWTAPAFRGRGLAAAATAAWARLLEDGGRLRFYSTAAANRSSQQVAARLGLRPLGWFWKVVPADHPDALAPGWSGSGGGGVGPGTGSG